MQAELGGRGEYGYYTATSPDGIHWRCSDTPVLSKREDDPRMSDCNTCMYDPLGNRFIAFTKRHIPRGDSFGDQDIHHRAPRRVFQRRLRKLEQPRDLSRC